MGKQTLLAEVGTSDIEQAIQSLHDLVEICRVKCGPHDEVILPNGRTNHAALVDAVALLKRISDVLYGEDYGDEQVTAEKGGA